MWEGCSRGTIGGLEEEETREDNGGDEPMLLMQVPETTMPASPVES
jgi:hypothetical protein